MKLIKYKPVALVGCFVLTGLMLFLWNALSQGSLTKASTGLNHAGVAVSESDNTGEVSRIAQAVAADRPQAGALTQGQEAPGNAVEIPPLSVPEHIVKFLNPLGGTVFLESYVRETLSEKDLPILHGALSDAKFAGQWSDIVFAISVLEEDKQAFEIVKKFVSSPWDWQSSGYAGDSSFVIREIMLSVRNMGWVDPELSGSFLQETFTRPGAEKFLENWRNVPLPDGVEFEGTLMNSVRYGAASAMLHSRSPELFKVVEDTFYELAPLNPSQRPDDGYTMEICRLHLGVRDLYNEMGWEEGIRYLCSLDGHSMFDVGSRLMSKYTNLELELSGRKKK